MQKHSDTPEPTTSPKRPQVAYIRYARRPLSKKKRIIIAMVVLIIIAAISACWWYKGTQTQSAYISSDRYQAVFLTNNQVYFGKLRHLSDGSSRLTDVYYLQPQTGPATDSASTKNDSAQADPSQSGGTKSTPQLVKLGSELHGPEDAIVFSKDQVLFWENLKKDSKVAKAIDEYLKK